MVGRKSRNIAVLSAHAPVIGPHAPVDRAVVIIGFNDPPVPMIYETTSLLRLVSGRGGFDG